MKKTITFLLLGFGIWGANAQLNCANATAVTNGTYNVTYTAGSQIPPMPCIGINFDGDTKAAWFKYTATENHNITVSSYIAGNPTYDTKVNVYQGPCGSLTCIGGNDDGGPNQTSIYTFAAMAGNVYYIVFDDAYDNSNFSFTVTEAPYIPPAFTTQPLALNSGYQMAVVDMNGDFLDDVVGVDNGNVTIMVQAADGSGFTAVSRTAPTTANMPNWTMAAGDYDRNGYNDLLYGNGSGAAIILASDDGLSFDNILQSDPGFYLFSQRTNFVDINNDGNLDAFVCHDVQKNVYFLNDGIGGFTFHQGLGEHANGGNYGSIWVDYDNDGDVDLFIAKCRGGSPTIGINELHRNEGGGVFTVIASATHPENNMSDIIQTWSSAWADYDNDGDMDALVGASSDSNGSHKLMVNNGDGTFTDGTAGSGYDTFGGMDIEHVTHDFNNDGWADVYGGGGQIMYNNGDMTFTPVSVTAPHGPMGDLNNDGFIDIYNKSFDNPNGTIYYGTPNENNWVKITLEGVESNRNGIGARVEVYAAGDGWSKQIRDVRSGDGFEFMSSLNTHFGLGTTDAIEKIVIKWPSGTVDTINNPSVNSTVHVVEGEHVVGTNEFANNMFTIYPNPVKDFITINGNDNINKIAIYDLNGRLVKTVDVTDGKASVQFLAKGVYMVKLTEISGKQYSSKIIKE